MPWNRSCSAGRGTFEQKSAEKHPFDHHLLGGAGAGTGEDRPDMGRGGSDPGGAEAPVPRVRHRIRAQPALHLLFPTVPRGAGGAEAGPLQPSAGSAVRLCGSGGGGHRPVLLCAPPGGGKHPSVRQQSVRLYGQPPGPGGRGVRPVRPGGRGFLQPERISAAGAGGGAEHSHQRGLPCAGHHQRGHLHPGGRSCSRSAAG